MTIPMWLMGGAALLLALGLTFVWRIQRGRLANQAWDFVTLGLCMVGLYGLGPWNLMLNLAFGLGLGIVCVIIRDFRLWLARAQDQRARRSRRDYWYGRANDWWRRRRR